MCIRMYPVSCVHVRVLSMTCIQSPSSCYHHLLLCIVPLFCASSELTCPSCLFFLHPSLFLSLQFPNLEGQTQDNPEFNLYDYKGSSWAMIFTHPTDFTPVCTSEFVELLKLKPEFEANDIKIVGFSTNVSDTHRNWLTDVEAIVNGYDMALENTVSQFTTDSMTSTTTKTSECNTSEIKVDFPIYSDPSLEMAVELGILDGDIKDEDGLPVTARSIYILTPDNKIAFITTYPSTVGRNWKEALRCVLALQLVERTKSCIHIPSHWEKGEKVLIDPKWTDSKCDKLFGKGNWERVFLPSEVCQEVGSFVSGTGGVRIKKEKKDKAKEADLVVTLPRHYMRYTSEPSDDHRLLESDEEEGKVANQEEKQEIDT